VLSLVREKIPARVKGAEAIGAWVAMEALGGSDEAERVLRAISHPTVHSLFTNYIAEAEQKLLQVHSSDEWPQGDRINDLELALQAPDTVRGLWRRSPESAEFRESVLNAPVAAALACACGSKFDKTQVYNLRRLREFDVEWFDTAYENVLKIAIGILLEAHPELLR